MDSQNLFAEMYPDLQIEEQNGDRIKVLCSCGKSWTCSLKSMLNYRTGCFDCIKKITNSKSGHQSSSIEETKILNFVKDKYLDEELRNQFKDALSEQHKIELTR